MLFKPAAAALSMLTVALATVPPTYTNYTNKWGASFQGSENTLPSSTWWNIVLGDQNDNNELQRYTNSNQNLKFSGKETLQIIPRKDATAPKGWTSARIETKFTITPEAGKVTRIESSLRIAGNPAKNKQGLWPAFWMMGNAYRNGVEWPACGEVDIFENINGQPTVVGVAHCDVYPNGICQEPVGLAANAPLEDNQFHVWRIDIDRKSSAFKDQSITWSKDGTQFHKITGTQVNNAAVWATLAQSPFYLILNVAMGGNWPGPPNADTWDGSGNMMEIQYVAHYVSN